MYCQQCRGYIPDGVGFAHCPNCNADLQSLSPVKNLPPVPEIPKEETPSPAPIKNKSNSWRVGYLVYLAVFVLLSIGFMTDSIANFYPVWLTILCAAGYLIISLGIFLYAIRFSNKIVTAIWKFVPFLFVLQLITESILDSQHMKVSVWMGMLIWAVALAIFYPAFRANILLGFPPESRLWNGLSAFRKRALESHLIAKVMLTCSVILIFLHFFTIWKPAYFIGLWMVIFIGSLFRLFVFTKNKKRNYAFSALSGVGIYAVIMYCILRPYAIANNGLDPAVIETDKVLVAPFLRTPNRGDIIIFHWDKFPGKDNISRVAALPGETVQLEDGKLLVNDGPLNIPPYNKNLYSEKEGGFMKKGDKLTVPVNSYFLLGDNSEALGDSLYYGYVPKKNIKGTVVLILSPVINDVFMARLANLLHVPSKKHQTPSYDLTYYYKKPQPKKVPAALKEYLNSENFLSKKVEESNNALQMAYLFGRVATLSPKILPEYYKIFKSANHEQRKFMVYVFQFCGNDGTGAFLKKCSEDPDFADEKDWILKALGGDIPVSTKRIEGPARSSNDLDMKWSEFMITGNTEPVKQIIDVLKWDDLFRKKISDYLKSSKDNKEFLELLDKPFNIRVVGGKILTEEDLDVKIGMDLMNGRVGKQFPALRKFLTIKDEDIMHAAVKSAAFWALNSNSVQHEKVFDVVKEAIRNASGEQKISLLMVAYQTAMSKDEPKLAEEYLMELTAANPGDDQALYSIFDIYLKQKNLTEANKVMERLRLVNPEMEALAQKELAFYKLNALLVSPDAKDAEASPYLEKFRDFLSKIETYASRIKLTSKNPTTGKSETIEWRFSHVLPDRYEVDQFTHEVADRWITVGKDNYSFFGFWLREPEGSDIAGRAVTNDLISVGKYASMVESQSPVLSKEFNSEVGPLFWMKFEDVSATNFGVMTDTKPDLELFLDETGVLKKAVLSWEGKDKESNEYIQIFDYPANIKIDRPQGAVDMQTKK